MGSDSDRRDSPSPPWQFSLITLLIVVTLVGVVAAAFAFDFGSGILAYMVRFQPLPPASGGPG